MVSNKRPAQEISREYKEWEETTVEGLKKLMAMML